MSNLVRRANMCNHVQPCARIEDLGFGRLTVASRSGLKYYGPYSCLVASARICGAWIHGMPTPRLHRLGIRLSWRS
jgi:hypothetical protein